MKKLAFSIVIVIIFSSLASAVSYEKIQKAADNMTSVQFDSYRRTLVGKRVTWIGEVRDVTKNWFNPNYEVKILMDGLTYDVQFDVSKDIAIRLKKGASYKFTGKIKRVTNVLGAAIVTLENVSF